MMYSDFCFWLEGFLDGVGKGGMTSDQVEIITRKLAELAETADDVIDYCNMPPEPSAARQPEGAPFQAVPYPPVGAPYYGPPPPFVAPHMIELMQQMATIRARTDRIEAALKNIEQHIAQNKP